MDKRKAAYDKWKANDTISNKNNYKNIATETKNEIERSQCNYFQNVLSNDIKDIRSNGRRFWKVKNKILTENNSSIGNLYINENDKTTTDNNKEMADALNKQFESVFNNNNETPPAVEADTNNVIKDFYVTRTGIIKFLKRQKSNKAMGADKISYKMLKPCKEEIADYLTNLFNASLETGELPSDWKHAEIIPLYKKDDRLKPSNYRPISLTSLICKMLEHIIVSNINKHLSKHNMMNKNQHGFRQGHSCETQLVETVDDWYREIDKGGQVDAIFLDFAKAFDKVPHKHLLAKLTTFGILEQTSVHKWIKEFLYNRTQCTCVNRTLSDIIHVTSGVP